MITYLEVELVRRDVSTLITRLERQDPVAAEELRRTLIHFRRASDRLSAAVRSRQPRIPLKDCGLPYAAAFNLGGLLT